MSVNDDFHQNTSHNNTMNLKLWQQMAASIYTQLTISPYDSLVNQKDDNLSDDDTWDSFFQDSEHFSDTWLELHVFLVICVS